MFKTFFPELDKGNISIAKDINIEDRFVTQFVFHFENLFLF